ncbi:MAG: Biopolymer transport protein ExbD [Acinetobacter bereziniae]|uniref:Biopolymer transport protein ExbD n=1 Tax=Acinetobacter bereziniae TaxID=106648 RepID=A0A833UVA6_ACIBZ|nr:MAG: Biopolymer transport protein ExbD [Acinetobacter bereziniae]
MAFKNPKHDDLGPVSEINVTPFIDVMLVLLIIFMVVAPLATVDVPLNLPTSKNAASPLADQPLILSLDASLHLYIDDKQITHDQLANQLRILSKGDKQQRIYIRADKTIPYEKFIDLINQLSALGYSKIALVNESLN